MSRKKSNKARIWIILGVIVVVGGLVAANFMTKRGPKAVDVDVAKAEVDSLVQKVTASGKVQPKTEVKISSNVAGEILYLGVEEGDEVEKGELLVQIEDEEYRAGVEQNEYSLHSYEASLEEARSKLKRVKELAGNNMASQADLEAAVASVKRLEADVERMRAQLQQSRDRLDKTRIYAPMDGVVTKLNKELGEIALGSSFSQDVIMVVSRLDAMEVEVEVNENDVVMVDLNDPVEVEVFAMPDTMFTGRVTEIDHSGTIRGAGSAEEVTNFMVTVTIEDFIPNLRPGMSATVDIVTDIRPNALVLPQETVAVRVMSDEERHAKRARSGMTNKNNGGDGDGVGMNGNRMRMGDREDPVEVVFVVEQDTVWAKQVTLGIYSDTHFEITSGLEEGDVVVSGPFRVLSRELHSGTLVDFKAPWDKNGKQGGDGEKSPDAGQENVEVASDGEETSDADLQTADASAS